MASSGIVPTKPRTGEKDKDGVDLVQALALDNDLCLLVDENDKFLGSASKRQCHRVGPDGKILLHRAFSVFLFNKRGDMLLQRRSAEKVTYANYYTNTCCSHPLYLDDKEEEIIAAARRRLNQELGIPLVQMDPKKFTYLTRVHYYDPGNGVSGEHEVDYILIFQDDVDINPNPEEIAECRYVPRNEFDSFIENLKWPLTPWFNIVRRHKLKLWWDNLHRLKEIAEPDKIHRYLNE